MLRSSAMKTTSASPPLGGARGRGALDDFGNLIMGHNIRAGHALRFSLEREGLKLCSRPGVNFLSYQKDKIKATNNKGMN